MTTLTQEPVSPAGPQGQPSGQRNGLPTATPTPGDPQARPVVRGKFLFVDGQKFYLKGVTYGPFRPTADGCEYKNAGVVHEDFALMARHGVNAVRVYTVPPRWFLNLAHNHGLKVMVGLPWEQHIAFLDDLPRERDIIRRLRQGVRSCADHPALLGYAVGNEIPVSIVRWHGASRIERFLHRLYDAAKSEDPGALVTYVNFPTTEYLKLPFLDFVCFNVYLEAEHKLKPYLARLHNIAGERPLVMAEVGLDSMRNGEELQAKTLAWQVQSFFSAGCAGGFVFSWTDEWYRGGHEITDWAFGMTTRNRQPKPALLSIGQVYAKAPFPRDLAWPKISVIVCTYNGARTIRECLSGIGKLDYPDFEVIVVNDGSRDETRKIAEGMGFRVLTTENQGLSSARNTGWRAAKGWIIAYIDDDAIPDPHWLYYLAHMFMTTDHAGVGGPNLAPLDSEPIADCVANSPGGPNHVLLTDEEAEHIPGCNMAFRRQCLEAIGGFDTTFRIAGDDVDLCWRLQKQGWTLGFSPAAVVWHRRRNRVRHYLKQQLNYGKAEAMLEIKWPEKYNTAGHLSWNGRIYSKGVAALLHWRRGRVYQGVWGTSSFQSIYEPAPDLLSSLPHIPEFYLIILALFSLSMLGFLWKPLFLALPLLAAAAGAVVALAALGALRASFTTQVRSRRQALRMRLLTGCLHVLQPIVRLRGRLALGLSPWRQRGTAGAVFPWDRTLAAWYETWQSTEARVEELERALQQQRVVVRRGSEYDRWDLKLRGGLLGGTRLRVAIEEHGSGKQLVLVRLLPTWSPMGVGMCLFFFLLAAGAASDHAWLPAGVLTSLALACTCRAMWESGAAIAMVIRVLEYSTAHSARLIAKSRQLPSQEAASPPPSPELP